MNKFVFWFFSILGCITLATVGSATWDLIHLPFANPLGITGPLTIANFNPHNNILRFIYFISLPSIFFLIFCNIYIRESCKKNLQLNSRGTSKYIYILLLIVIYSLLVSFIHGFEDFSPFDSFHEGESLTAAYNTFLGLGLWKGTYFIHGAFYDPLKALLGWYIFDNQTIGSFRFINYILNAFILPLCFYIFIFAKLYLTRNSILKIIPLIILVISTFEGFFNYFNQRDIIVFVVLTLIIFERLKQNIILNVLIGGLVVTNYFYTIDRGIYLLCAVFVYYAVQYIISADKRKSILKILTFLFGLIISTVFYVLFFGVEEIGYFIDTTISFYTEKDLFDSYIFPRPTLSTFTNYSSFSLYLLIFTILVFIYCYFKYYRYKSNENIFILHLLLIILSVFYFRSALGRSDFYHIRYSTGFLILSSLYVFIPILQTYNDKLIKFIKDIKIVLLSVFCFQLFSIPHDLDKIISFHNRITNYTSLHNAHFLHNYMTIDTLNDLQDLFSKEDTVFNYTSEAALPYLLNTKHCGRYYIPWFGSSTKRQIEMVNNIEENKPSFIIFKSNHFSNQMDNISNYQRFPFLDDYIKNNYHPFKKYQDNWWIFSNQNFTDNNISLADKIHLYSESIYPFISQDKYKSSNILFHHSGYSFKVSSNLLIDHYKSNIINAEFGIKDEALGKFHDTNLIIKEISKDSTSILHESLFSKDDNISVKDISFKVTENNVLEFSVLPIEGSINAWGWFFWLFP